MVATSQSSATKESGEFVPNCVFDIRQFMGKINMDMNAPHAEALSSFILSMPSSEVPKHLWAMAEHLQNNSRKAREYISNRGGRSYSNSYEDRGD